MQTFKINGYYSTDFYGSPYLCVKRTKSYVYLYDEEKDLIIKRKPKVWYTFNGAYEYVEINKNIIQAS